MLSAIQDNQYIFSFIPMLAAEKAPFVSLDHSTRCKNCRFPSSSQRAQNAQWGLSLICAWNEKWEHHSEFNHHCLETPVNRLWRRGSHHLASGLMIWGWSQMNVGQMQVSSRNSPTNCGFNDIYFSAIKPYSICTCKDDIHTPCPGA